MTTSINRLCIIAGRWWRVFSVEIFSVLTSTALVPEVSFVISTQLCRHWQLVKDARTAFWTICLQPSKAVTSSTINVGEQWQLSGDSPAERSHRSCRRIFFSRVNSLWRLLFWNLFHPLIPAVTRKRSWSFCRKCRWQRTVKRTHTLPIWLWMMWH